MTVSLGGSLPGLHKTFKIGMNIYSGYGRALVGPYLPCSRKKRQAEINHTIPTNATTLLRSLRACAVAPSS